MYIKVHRREKVELTGLIAEKQKRRRAKRVARRGGARRPGGAQTKEAPPRAPKKKGERNGDAGCADAKLTEQLQAHRARPNMAV